MQVYLVSKHHSSSPWKSKTGNSVIKYSQISLTINSRGEFENEPTRLLTLCLMIESLIEIHFCSLHPAKTEYGRGLALCRYHCDVFSMYRQ